MFRRYLQLAKYAGIATFSVNLVSTFTNSQIKMIEEPEIAMKGLIMKSVGLGLFFPKIPFILYNNYHDYFILGNKYGELYRSYVKHCEMVGMAKDYDQSMYFEFKDKEDRVRKIYIPSLIYPFNVGDNKYIPIERLISENASLAICGDGNYLKMNGKFERLNYVVKDEQNIHLNFDLVDIFFSKKDGNVVYTIFDKGDIIEEGILHRYSPVGLESTKSIDEISTLFT